MKYVYFDCFAGIDPFMILAAFADMGTDAKTFEKHFLPGVSISFGKEKRLGMDSVVAHFDSSYPQKNVGAKEIESLIESVSHMGECEKVLKTYFSILKETCFFDPENAQFDIFEQSIYISAICAIWNEIKAIGGEKIYVSPIFTSSEEGLFGAYTKPETLCISKKYAIETRLAKEYEEIFSPCASAMLASFGAQSVSGFTPSSVLKIGYGAGKWELQTLANVLRVVIGEDFSDSLMFGEELMGSFAKNPDYAGMKER